MKIDRRVRKTLMLATKICVGSSLSIYIANYLQLDFATSAGTITLLTLLTTKWETMRLSLYRLLTFVVTVLIAWITFTHCSSEWIAYGIFIFCLVLISYFFGWKATISVNAVIGTHFLSTLEFDGRFIVNEFLLVLIGITMAIILNLFNNNRGHRREIIANMRYTEEQLQSILGEIAMYLRNQEMEQSVWAKIVALEKELLTFSEGAYEYQENTFHSHPQYYIDYFEMRKSQCSVLHSLHYELRRMRSMPKQAEVVADYILYLKKYVVEVNRPEKQMQRLNELFEWMKQEPLPVTREEFESRSMLYHVLMDLEEFLKCKVRFVQGLDEFQKKHYWKDEEKEETVSEGKDHNLKQNEGK